MCDCVWLVWGVGNGWRWVVVGGRMCCLCVMVERTICGALNVLRGLVCFVNGG